MLFNFGSINIDHVYRMPQLPKPGETLLASSYEKFLGGKGLNQSVAAHRAGGKNTHIGLIGPDGDWAREKMVAFGLSTEFVQIVDMPTGNAVVYVDADAENQIVVLGGANQAFTDEIIKTSLEAVAMGDWVVLQNEINKTEVIAKKAKEKGAKICYSAAPFDREAVLSILPMIDLLAMNEHEAEEVEKAIGKDIAKAGPDMVLVTFGAKGAKLFLDGDVVAQPAFRVEPVNTTGAGDTFLGSFIARFDRGDGPNQALNYAAGAAALQVTKEGAANAIPAYSEVTKFIEAQS